MRETSMIPASETQAPAEGTSQRVTIQESQVIVSSGHISTEVSMFPVRVKSADAQVRVLVDVELLKRQREVQEANEEIRRRLRG